MLPGLSGYEVVRRLRAEDNWVPVLMLSAKDGEYDQADALDEGADDYLTKPFSFVVLLARLRALLRRAVVARPAVLTVGELRLDPSSREVFLGEERVALTPREFLLLEYLMRNPGRAIGKEELLTHVWDSAEEMARKRGGGVRRLSAAQAGHGAGGHRTGGRIPAGRMRNTPAAGGSGLRRLSLRARLMIIGVSGLAIALLVGGLALFAALRVAVDRTLDTEARATAEQVAAMVAEDRLPSPIPVSGAQLIQVVDGEGRVIGGSLLADRLTPLLRPDELSRALAGSAVEVSGARAGLDGPLRVVAAAGRAPRRQRHRGQSGRGRRGQPAHAAERVADLVPAAARPARGDRVRRDRLDAAAGRAAPARCREDQRRRS